jgi:CubicO group peptidase (beta-lactamase class C family)
MRRRITPLLLVSLFLLSVPVLGQSGDKAVNKYQKLDSRIRQILKQTGVVGVSVAIIDDYKLAWAKGFGLRQVGSRDSVTRETLFQAASLTKAVTAMAVMRKVQEGKLSLEEDVNQRLFSWKLPYPDSLKTNPITLKQLLSHTSGINAASYQPYCPQQESPGLLQVFHAWGQQTPSTLTPATPPGNFYSYSGINYAIIQQILSEAEKTDYATIIGQTVLEPLGMHSSTFERVLPSTAYPSVAYGHWNGKEKIDCNYYHSQPLAPGGLWSTPSDLARFLIEIQLSLRGRSNRVLSQENTSVMLQPVRQAPPPRQYALGFSLEKRGTGVLFFGHDGHNYGYVASMIASRDQGFGVVIMTNGENGWKAVNKIKKLVGRDYWGF